MRDYVDAIWGWDDVEQRAFFDARFNPPSHQILRVDGADVGTISVEERGDEIFLAQIEVLPEWQGRGIGSSVVTHVLARGSAAHKPVTLRVLRSNHRAVALYERLGFERSGQTETHIYLRHRP